MQARPVFFPRTSSGCELDKESSQSRGSLVSPPEQEEQPADPLSLVGAKNNRGLQAAPKLRGGELRREGRAEHKVRDHAPPQRAAACSNVPVMLAKVSAITAAPLIHRLAAGITPVAAATFAAFFTAAAVGNPQGLEMLLVCERHQLHQRGEHLERREACRDQAVAALRQTTTFVGLYSS